MSQTVKQSMTLSIFPNRKKKLKSIKRPIALTGIEDKSAKMNCQWK